MKKWLVKRSCQVGHEAENQHWCDMCALLHQEKPFKQKTVDLRKIYDENDNCRTLNTFIDLSVNVNGTDLSESLTYSPFYTSEEEGRLDSVSHWNRNISKYMYYLTHVSMFHATLFDHHTDWRVSLRSENINIWETPAPWDLICDGVLWISGRCGHLFIPWWLHWKGC